MTMSGKRPAFKERRIRMKNQDALLLYVRLSLCSAPIKAIKDQATLLGFEVGPDQDVS